MERCIVIFYCVRHFDFVFFLYSFGKLVINDKKTENVTRKIIEYRYITVLFSWLIGIIDLLISASKINANKYLMSDKVQFKSRIISKRNNVNCLINNIDATRQIYIDLN